MNHELLWEGIAWLHLASSWFMVGLVWFVQYVHYPLLYDLPATAVPTYQQAHIRRTFPLIPLVMLTEALTALLLWPGQVTDSVGWAWLVNTISLAVVWLLTFAVLVPLHQRLTLGYDPRTHQRLLRWNLARSVAWLAHGLAATGLLRAILR